MNVKFRVASDNDVDDIYDLLSFYATKGLLLSRSKENILKYINNFVIAEQADNVVACSAVRDFDNNLYEIRSLAVHNDFIGKGIGKELVRFIIRDVDKKHLTYKLFALTYQEQFFYKLGFKDISKTEFPEKIWADCQFCKKKDCCDENAVFIEKF